MKSWSQYWLAVFSSFAYPRKRKRKMALLNFMYCGLLHILFVKLYVSPSSCSFICCVSLLYLFLALVSFCHLSWFFTDVKKGSFFVTLLSVDPSINTDMYLQLLRASTRSSLIVSPIMLANSWHLCSVWYVCPRQTPCLLSSSTIAGELGEEHLLPWDHVRHLKQAADAILLLGRSRSYGSPDGRAPQDFVYRSRRLSLKRNGLLVDVRFRMLDNVVFFERASGNAMHERAPCCSFWWLEGDPRSSTKGSGCDLPHRCLVVMEPLA